MYCFERSTVEKKRTHCIEIQTTHTHDIFGVEGTQSLESRWIHNINRPWHRSWLHRSPLYRSTHFAIRYSHIRSHHTNTRTRRFLCGSTLFCLIRVCSTFRNNLIGPHQFKNHGSNGSKSSSIRWRGRFLWTTIDYSSSIGAHHIGRHSKTAGKRVRNSGFIGTGA